MFSILGAPNRPIVLDLRTQLKKQECVRTTHGNQLTEKVKQTEQAKEKETQKCPSGEEARDHEAHKQHAYQSEATYSP